MERKRAINRAVLGLGLAALLVAGAVRLWAWNLGRLGVPGAAVPVRPEGTKAPEPFNPPAPPRPVGPSLAELTGIELGFIFVPDGEPLADVEIAEPGLLIVEPKAWSRFKPGEPFQVGIRLWPGKGDHLPALVLAELRRSGQLAGSNIARPMRRLPDGSIYLVSELVGPPQPGRYAIRVQVLYDVTHEGLPEPGQVPKVRSERYFSDDLPVVVR